MVCLFLFGPLSHLVTQWLVSVKHSTVSAADIGVALAQCWYLHFARTGLRRCVISESTNQVSDEFAVKDRFLNQYLDAIHYQPRGFECVRSTPFFLALFF